MQPVKTGKAIDAHRLRQAYRRALDYLLLSMIITVNIQSLPLKQHAVS